MKGSRVLTYLSNRDMDSHIVSTFYACPAQWKRTFHLMYEGCHASIGYLDKRDSDVVRVPGFCTRLRPSAGVNVATSYVKICFEPQGRGLQHDASGSFVPLIDRVLLL